MELPSAVDGDAGTPRTIGIDLVLILRDVEAKKGRAMKLCGRCDVQEREDRWNDVDEADRSTFSDARRHTRSHKAEGNPHELSIELFTVPTVELGNHALCEALLVDPSIRRRVLPQPFAVVTREDNERVFAEPALIEVVEEASKLLVCLKYLGVIRSEETLHLSVLPIADRASVVRGESSFIARPALW